MVAETTTPDGGQRKLVCFTLRGQEYAADIAEVKESMAIRPITRVFLTPAWLAGIINLRGDVLAVIDLALFLGMARTLITDESRIIVARHDGRRVGILCDSLADLRVVDASEIAPPPATLGDEAQGIIRGVVTVDGGAALRVLDLAHLFESERLDAFRHRRDR